MPDCHSETTITQNTNKIMAKGHYYQEPKEMDGSDVFINLKKESKSMAVVHNPRAPSKPLPNAKDVEFVISGNPFLLNPSQKDSVLGNFIPVDEAMRLEVEYNEIEHLNYKELEIKESEGSFVFVSQNQKNFLGIDMGESAGLRFFIGITSKCCTEQSRRNRDAIRNTWMKHALSTFDNVEIKFFLGQPDLADASHAAELLNEELQQFQDVVVIRGHDLYENLPNKTFGMLKYALSAPQKYTHVLKTDDDCYVRVHKLMEILDPPEGPQFEGMYKGCIENRGGFWPIRDPNSKWYLRYDELDDFTARPIKGTKYLAGWGYIVSRDVIFHAMKKVYAWDNKLENVPAWYPIMKWEDVLMGILVTGKIEYPDADYHFKAAWRACTNETAVRI